MKRMSEVLSLSLCVSLPLSLSPGRFGHSSESEVNFIFLQELASLVQSVLDAPVAVTHERSQPIDHHADVAKNLKNTIMCRTNLYIYQNQNI